MKTCTIYIVCLLVLSCGNNNSFDKREAYRQLRLDTDILPAIEHFSTLVNCDNLPKIDINPVMLHVLISKGEEFPYCSIMATRLHKQYNDAIILGETECNGYRVIFHARDTSLYPSVLKDVHLEKTDYHKDDDYESPVETVENSFYINTYMVMFRIKEDKSLQFFVMLGRSPSEVLEWGIDDRTVGSSPEWTSSRNPSGICLGDLTGGVQSRALRIATRPPST